MSTLILQQKIESFSFIHMVVSATSVMQLWVDRHHQRQQLAKLEAWQLEDIGLTAAQVEQEVSKPFWK